MNIKKHILNPTTYSVMVVEDFLNILISLNIRLTDLEYRKAIREYWKSLGGVE